MKTIGEITFEPISDKYTEDAKNAFIRPRVPYQFTIIHPSNCVLISKFQNYVQKIQDFKVYSDDVWIVTFPKAGTTWTQEMTWLMMNDLDFEKARTVPLRIRSPFLEWEAVWSITDDKFYEGSIDLTAGATRPRCIKSHLPLQLLPNELWTVKPKIIYVARDPRDTAVSFYHHYRFWDGYVGTLEEFIHAFLADRVIYSPYWSHVLDFHKIKDQPNILFNTYEEMKKDLSRVIKKTANFLDINLDDKKVERLTEHLSFKNMKNNASCNYMDVGFKVKENQNGENLSFIRKGESGGWKNVLTSDMLDKFNTWNKKHLQGTGFEKYPWS